MGIRAHPGGGQLQLPAERPVQPARLRGAARRLLAGTLTGVTLLALAGYLVPQWLQADTAAASMRIRPGRAGAEAGLTGVTVTPEPALAPAAPTLAEAAATPALEPTQPSDIPGAKNSPEPALPFAQHTVQPGENLTTVARSHGLDLDTLLANNSLVPDDLLAAGRELLVPRLNGLLVRVASGDTLWDLSQENGVDPDGMIRANPNVEPGSLQPGTWLLIPGAQPVSRRLQLASRAGTRADANAGALTDPARTAPSAVNAVPVPATTAGTPVRSFGLWPLRGPITDPYGWRIHPVYGTRSFHDGLDIAGDVGTPIVAVVSGRVVLAEGYGGWGLTIKVDSGGGLVTRYSHASVLLAKVGETVVAGQTIARVGNTGVSTGPHLDFGVYVNGSPRDPMAWLP